MHSLHSMLTASRKEYKKLMGRFNHEINIKDQYIEKYTDANALCKKRAAKMNKYIK